MSDIDTIRFGPAQLITAAAHTDAMDAWSEVGDGRGESALAVELMTATGRLDRFGSIPFARSVRAMNKPMLRTRLTGRDVRDLALLYPGGIELTSEAQKALGMKVTSRRIEPRAWALVATEVWDAYQAGTGAWIASNDTAIVPYGIARITSPLDYAPIDGETDDLYEERAFDVEVMALGKPGAEFSAFRGFPALLGLQTGGVIVHAAVAAVDLISNVPITFSSPSVRYARDFATGGYRSYAANEKRIVSESGRPALLLDAQRTNLVPGSKQKFEGWTAIAGADVTITQGQTIPDYPAGLATRIQVPAGSGTNRVKLTLPLSAWAGAHTISCVIRNQAAQPARFDGNEVPGSVIVASGATVRASLTDTDGAASPSISLGPSVQGDALDVLVLWPQVEAGSVATNPIVGTSSGTITTVRDQLTIPDLVLPARPFTVVLKGRAIEGVPATTNEIPLSIGKGSDYLRLLESETTAGVHPGNASGSAGVSVATATARQSATTVLHVKDSGITHYRNSMAIQTDVGAANLPVSGAGFTIELPLGAVGAIALEKLIVMSGIVSPEAAETL